MMVEQALSDIKVIDLTHYIAGPACTKTLGDYGADVIKIERPGVGDGARRMGPFYHDEPHPEKSGPFLFLNANKRGITLNLKTKLGKEIFKELVKGADVVVENFRPGVMERLRLGYEELEKINPRLVVTSISNFGQYGPYRDFKSSELMVYGMGGRMLATGLADREPQKLGLTVTIYQSGVTAAIATMMGVYASRYQDVAGQHIDVSIMETQAGSIDSRMQSMVNYQYTGKLAARGVAGGAGYPGGSYACADGYFRITASGPRFPRAVAMMGNPPELMDPKWYTPEAQTDPQLKGEFEALFRAFCMRHTKRDLFILGEDTGNICVPEYTVDDVFNDPHFEATGFFVEVDHPMTGKVKYPGRTSAMEETPWAIRRPAPLLGQHNEEVYAELGYTRGDLGKLREYGVI